MKKYCQPTLSSMQKSKESIITKEKLDRLTGEVKKLQNKAKHEISYKNTFERETSKVNDEVQTQMNDLKTSFINTFNSLSDIMVEEFESIRVEMQNVGISQCCSMQRTIEHLTLLCTKYDNDILYLNNRMDKAESYISNIPAKDFNDEIEITVPKLLINMKICLQSIYLCLYFSN